MLQKFKVLWRNFWGTRYWVYEDDKREKELLIYHRRIYAKKIKEDK